MMKLYVCPSRRESFGDFGISRWRWEKIITQLVVFNKSMDVGQPMGCGRPSVCLSWFLLPLRRITFMT